MLVELASGPQKGAGLGLGQPEAKRAQLCTTYHQAVDLCMLFNGSWVNPDGAPMSREVGDNVIR